MRGEDLGFGQEHPRFSGGGVLFLCVYQTNASSFENGDFVGDAGSFGEHGLG